MIDEETIKKAQESLNKYWESMWSNFTFFKKTEIDLTVFLLPTWDIYFPYRDKCLEAHNNSFQWIARYWASAYLDMHLCFMWNEDVSRAILIDKLDMKKAWVLADKNKLERTKKLQELYP